MNTNMIGLDGFLKHLHPFALLLLWTKVALALDGLSLPMLRLLLSKAQGCKGL